METIKYENLPLREYKKYHKIFEQRGRLISDGEEIIPTEWAYQNGVFKRNDKRKMIKAGNTRLPSAIKVFLGSNKQPNSYWAGFWQPRNS